MDQRADIIHHPEIAGDTDHRIGNSLAVLGGLVRLQASAIGKTGQVFSAAEVRLLLDGVAARISTVAQVHHRLAQMPDGLVAFGPHLHEICEGIVAAFSSEQQRVHMDYRFSDCLVSTKLVQPLTLIVNELMHNALKYAHPAGVPLRLSVGCDSRRKALVVTIDDDGVGLPEGFDPATDGNLGFRVIRSLCAELHAELDVQSSSLGTSFEITVPDAIAANLQTA
ncbi:MAG TPA: sensor histidine kinase [Rhizomicrobium sp.]|jgi:two-component sensor histidine kinase|nr:sensor histidine kinase [Rhizomicrobium sp.]